MRKIYIIATNNHTMTSKVFKLFTREKYVHISIALDSKFKNVYSFGRKNPKRPLPAGFVNEDFNSICEYYSSSDCAVYELEINNKDYYHLKQDIKQKYIKNKIKFHYNIRGIPFLNFNIRHHREYHYVCTQFCGKLLMDAGIINFEKDYSLLKPKDFFNIENTTLVYEGKTSNYLQGL